MLERYKTVYRGKEGEIIEKKSRFIATVRLVETEEEALAFIEEMKKKYWNATHNCFAYVIGERRECVRCSDDGEPSGTAGKPMLDVCKLSLPIAFTHCTQVFLLQAFITDMLQMQMASDTSFPALLFLQISPAHSISSDPVLFPAHPRSLRILSSAILHD